MKLTLLTRARYSRELPETPYLLHTLVGDGTTRRSSKRLKELFKLKEVEMRTYMRTLLEMMSEYNSGHDRNASLYGNEYINCFLYSVVYFLLVTVLS